MDIDILPDIKLQERNDNGFSIQWNKAVQKADAIGNTLTSPTKLEAVMS